MFIWQRSIIVAFVFAFVACTALGQARAPLSADALFDRYVEAIGGEHGVRSITTRVTVGELIAGSNRAPLEIYQGAPDRFVRVLRNTQVTLSENGFDGTIGWSRNDDRRRVVTGPELQQFQREYHVHRPAMLRGEYTTVEVLSDTLIDSQTVARVRGTTAAGSVEVLYFNRSTGFLDGWDQTVRGTPIETRFSDYRSVQGVRVPFRIERRRPGFRWVEQASEIRHNVVIDASRFSPPPAPGE